MSPQAINMIKWQHVRQIINRTRLTVLIPDDDQNEFAEIFFYGKEMQ